MVAGSIAEDVAMAVPAELLWKGAFSPDASTVQKAFAGMVDAVEFDGDGGPGSLVTMKFGPGAMGEATLLKSRLVARDHAARVISRDEVVVEGGAAATQLRSQAVRVKVVPAGEGACVAKVTVEYERLDGAALLPEDQAKLVKGYVGLVKKAEANLAARPGEFA
ncbi:hypothetical protein GQ55_3G431300 [Panicum hallii var. hallii]|uniref:Bet v I/Major latex protein domain-containing protein n=1 Tax=Panicum hallii var. hallii TaxID=1504633 RepID=A0A2T7EHT9_9POAL|nr:hypothetical protein GQ55_3G431300 [Panicum hallii var. hallii]